MQVTVEYEAQVKRAAGTRKEDVELDTPCSLQEFLTRIAETHGDPLRSLLFHADGHLQPSILVFVGDEQVQRDEVRQLRDRDIVTLLSPISGG